MFCLQSMLERPLFGCIRARLGSPLFLCLETNSFSCVSFNIYCAIRLTFKRLLRSLRRILLEFKGFINPAYLLSKIYIYNICYILYICLFTCCFVCFVLFVLFIYLFFMFLGICRCFF